MSQSPLDPADPAQAYKGAWSAISRLIRDGLSWSGHERNCAFLGKGGGRFVDASAVLGLDHDEDARAAVQLDWDLDGDLDLFVSARTAPRLRFLENRYEGPNRSVALRLVGTNGNTDALGARVVLELPEEGTEEGTGETATGPLALAATRRAGAGYLAQSSAWMTFGCGERREGRVTVYWPGGEPEVFEVRSGLRYVLVQGSGQARPQSKPSQAASSPIPADPPRSFGPERRVVLAAPLPVPALDVELASGKAARLFGVGAGGVGRRLRAPLLVHVWASWCTPCVGELTETLGASDELRAAGVDVLSLGVDEGEARKRAVALLERLGWRFPQAYLTPDAAAILDVLLAALVDRAEGLPLPTSLLLADDGRLHVAYFGRVSPERVLADLELLELGPREHRRRAVPFEGSFLDPAGPPQVNPLSVALRRAGQSAAADELLQANVTVAQVGAFDMAMRIGEARVAQGRNEDALREFTKATELDETSARAWAARAYCELVTEDAAAAAESYQQALLLDPQDRTSGFNLALALANSGDVEGALRAQAQLALRDKALAAKLDAPIAAARAAKDDD